MGTWRDEWETIGYEAAVGTMGDGYRMRIRTERGRVVRYTVQFEAWIAERLRPALRFDSAHSAPHRDTLDWEERVANKVFFPDLTLDEALENAIKSNWRRH